MADGSFLVRLFSEGELELILRKLPPEIAMAHREKDDFIVEYLAKTIPALRNMDTQLFSAALRGVFIAMLHKDEIGRHVFDEALKVMINGVVNQMYAGGKPDGCSGEPDALKNKGELV